MKVAAFWRSPSLNIAKGDCGKDDSQRVVFAHDALQGIDGLREISQTHLLVAFRDSQERLLGFKGQALFDLVASQFQLVLILVDPCAMVVDHRSVRGIHMERGV